MAVSIPRITYEDKVDYQTQGQDDRYKVTAKDMNEIKNTFNTTAKTVEDSINNLDAATTGAQANMEKSKEYMKSAKASADSVLNGLGLSIVDGCICMEGE